MKNVFTVDLEEFYCCNLSDNDVTKDYGISTIEQNTKTLLELFKKYNVNATFFVLATIAEEFPELVKEIADSGHEIASHGYGHELIYKIGPAKFKEDVVKSKQLIEQACNKKVKGYRAPSWSITNDSLWALPILEEAGFEYSSSIFPIHTFLYGIKDAPKVPNYPIVDGKKLDILEIPPSTYNFVVKELGFSGGFFFRVLPFFITKFIIKQKNKKNIPVICYIHPWELDKNTPDLDLKGIDRIIHYYGIRGCQKKLEKLFKNFQFVSIENLMEKGEL